MSQVTKKSKDVSQVIKNQKMCLKLQKIKRCFSSYKKSKDVSQVKKKRIDVFQVTKKNPQIDVYQVTKKDRCVSGYPKKQWLLETFRREDTRDSFTGQ